MPPGEAMAQPVVNVKDSDLNYCPYLQIDNFLPRKMGHSSPFQLPAPFIPYFTKVTCTSTRRFWARCSSVVLGQAGSSSPRNFTSV